MDRISRWKLADELNVFQIALLLADYDPSEFEIDAYDRWPPEVRADISGALHSLKNAALSGKISYKEEFNYHHDGQELDWYNSMLDVESLRVWLRLKNFKDGFFLERPTESHGLADRSSQYYAPKLAAAVRAWNEVTSDLQALNGKSPKKALEIWLRKHANEFGLTGPDGNPNKLGIEEICKVANWKLTGGASPTPTPLAKPTQVKELVGRKVRPEPPTRSPVSNLNDEIPF